MNTTQHAAYQRDLDMTDYDYTTASHGDSRDPWPQPDEWRYTDESADVRGTMYWSARDYA